MPAAMAAARVRYVVLCAMTRIGFLINPIAGMGGRVGLKGTDGVADRARALGAEPVANARALEALAEFKRLVKGMPHPPVVEWWAAAGAMGSEALHTAGLTVGAIVHMPADPPSAQDTRTTVERFLAAPVDLILFCAGDGTARDICALTGDATPVLGIPAGVKMHSGVFGVTPAKTAQALVRYLAGEIGLAPAEVVDLDEERYRQGEWVVRLYMVARTPFEANCMQPTKTPSSGADEAAAQDDIAAELLEDMARNPSALYLLGPGSTVQAIGRALRIDKTLLGIDAVADGKIIGKDLAERAILDLLDRYRERKLVLSPIGAQGFVLGRGNQPLSPEVVRRIGADNLIVISTPGKLARTPWLRFDTGDPALDAAMTSRKFFEVIIGYHRRRLVRVAP